MIGDLLEIVRKSETGRDLLAGEPLQVEFSASMGPAQAGACRGDIIQLNPDIINGLPPEKAKGILLSTLVHEMEHARQWRAGFLKRGAITCLHPEDFVLLTKMAEADAVATSLRVAFELARSGHPAMLHCWAGGENMKYRKAMEAFRGSLRADPDDLGAAAGRAFCAWFLDREMGIAYEQAALDHYEGVAQKLARAGGRISGQAVRMPRKIAESPDGMGLFLDQMRCWFPAMPEGEGARFLAEPFTIIHDVSVWHDLPIAFGRMETARRSLARKLQQQAPKPAP